MRHTATIENIDAKLLFEQKCDLLDLIGFLEELYENYDNYAFPKIGFLEELYENYDNYAFPKKKIESLNGILHILDAITDQIEKD